LSPRSIRAAPADDLRSRSAGRDDGGGGRGLSRGGNSADRRGQLLRRGGGFKPERINPVSNVKNLFSLRAAARLAKSLIPASLLAVFAVQRIGGS
jgi:hypothetical protein